ncbi:ACT domain-containing protein [Agromyces albus]|uniref:ACT domain-containing protein n=1 Tax=Agromyces albus TaxID=205332 RepID=A0A4V1QYE9_9MICO|nr:ACT domain-containing protein [Agromyces albus]RXZ72916.1 ACT domain-containing protein [Agromyces albus]
MAVITVDVVPQHLALLDGEYAVEPVSGESVPIGSDYELAVVRAPDGTTRVRRASETDRERWLAFYSGGTAHGLETPGMTVSVIAPLSAAGCPIFVASTATADLVLVPLTHRQLAVDALIAAGHTVAD